MKQVAPKLWVGSDADFLALDQFGTEWAVVHAAKDRWHRAFVGYKTVSAPQGPEYYTALRGKRLALNMIDAPDPKYINKGMVDAALAFIDAQLTLLQGSDQLLVACNQGSSRAPTLAMLYLAPSLSPNFETAVKVFTDLYPDYRPGNGVREFARIHWSYYHNRKATSAAPAPAASDWALDKARELVSAFGSDLGTVPDKAVGNLISGIRAALLNARDHESEPAHGALEIKRQDAR